MLKNPIKFYSICPSLTCITRSTLHRKLSTDLRTGSRKSTLTKIKSEFTRYLKGYS